LAVVGTPLVIDGSHGEGGASLVRTALALASITQQPMRIVNIRMDARKPGLSTEDLLALRSFASICGAQVIGGELGEKSLSFIPTRKPKGLNQELDFPAGTDGGHANAIVVMNGLLPVLAKTGVYSTISCQGETYGNNVLSYDYFNNVTLCALRKLGLYAYCDLATAGFGVGSRGEVSLEVEPSAIQGVQWPDRGRLVAVRAVVVAGELPAEVADRGVKHLGRLAFYANLAIEAEAVTVKSKTPGAYATVWAEFERGFGGATAMGARGVRMEAVVQNAFESFSEWFQTDATVDPYLADQLLLSAALAEGETNFKVSRLTQRFLTVAWVIKQFIPLHITIKGQEGQPGTVTIRR
jgi:RNA 3'-terminal phosphate cyclase (ATP)